MLGQLFSPLKNTIKKIFFLNFCRQSTIEFKLLKDNIKLQLIFSQIQKLSCMNQQTYSNMAPDRTYHLQTAPQHPKAYPQTLIKPQGQSERPPNRVNVSAPQVPDMPQNNSPSSPSINEKEIADQKIIGNPQCDSTGQKKQSCKQKICCQGGINRNQLIFWICIFFLFIPAIVIAGIYWTTTSRPSQADVSATRSPSHQTPPTRNPKRAPAKTNNNINQISNPPSTKATPKDEPPHSHLPIVINPPTKTTPKDQPTHIHPIETTSSSPAATTTKSPTSNPNLVSDTTSSNPPPSKAPITITQHPHPSNPTDSTSIIPEPTQNSAQARSQPPKSGGSSSSSTQSAAKDSIIPKPSNPQHSHLKIENGKPVAVATKLSTQNAPAANLHSHPDMPINSNTSNNPQLNSSGTSSSISPTTTNSAKSSVLSTGTSTTSLSTQQTENQTSSTPTAKSQSGTHSPNN